MKRSLKYAGFAVAVIVVAGFVFALAMPRTVTAYLFYLRHPLLKAIADVQTGNLITDQEPGRRVLLSYVPLGTDKTTAIATLRKQGFRCTNSGAPGASGARVDCAARAPQNTGILRRWTVGLQFDGADHLTEAAAASWGVASRRSLLKKWSLAPWWPGDGIRRVLSRL